jgi:hypothetical protein
MNSKTEVNSQEPPLIDGNVFEHLMGLNQEVEGAIELLRRLARYPVLNTESFIIYQTYFREYLADANLHVIYDPDDCYIDVVRREEELRLQGRPSQLGILFGMRKAEIVGDPPDEDEEGKSDSEVHSDQPD